MKTYNAHLSILFPLVFLCLTHSIQANVVTGPQTIFSFPTMTCAEPGEKVCIEVMTGCFDDVLAFQYDVRFDPMVLQFNLGTSEVFETSDFIATESITNDSIIHIAYGSLMGIPLSVSENTTVYSLCFTAIGAMDSCTDLEFIQDENDFIFNNGEVCLKEIEDGFEVDITVNTACGKSKGSFEVELSGGVPPYTVFVNFCDDGTVVLGPETIVENLSVLNLSPDAYCLTIADNSVPPIIILPEVIVPFGEARFVNGFDSISVSSPSAMDGELEVLIEPSDVPIASYNWRELVTGTTYKGNPISNIGVGIYKVTVTDEVGCTVEASANLSSGPVSTENFLEMNEFTVFPNPSRDGKFDIRLDAPFGQKYQISITNILGEQIHYFSEVKSNSALALKLEDEGFFFINLISGGKYILSKKIITKK